MKCCCAIHQSLSLEGKLGGATLLVTFLSNSVFHTLEEQLEKQLSARDHDLQESGSNVCVWEENLDSV